MQLQKVIEPEVILGLRGAGERQFVYKNILSQLVFADNHGHQIVAHKKGGRAMRIMEEDANAATYFASCKFFEADKEKKVFFVPKNFARALSQLDKDIPMQLLKPGFVAWIQFADGAICDEDGPVEGGFIHVCTAASSGMWIHPDDTNVHNVRGTTVTNPDALCVTISYICAGPGREAKSTFPWSVASLRTELFGGMSLSEITSRPNLYITEDILKTGEVAEPSKDTVNKRGEVINAIFNAALYACSHDPEIANLVPVRLMNKPERELSKARYGIENMCTLPVTVLNRAFAMGANYNMDEWRVRAHFRWQACGPGFRDSKLIMIDEHGAKRRAAGKE